MIWWLVCVAKCLFFCNVHFPNQGFAKHAPPTNGMEHAMIAGHDRQFHMVFAPQHVSATDSAHASVVVLSSWVEHCQKVDIIELEFSRINPPVCIQNRHMIVRTVHLLAMCSRC